MAGIKFTEEQQKAIDTVDKSSSGVCSCGIGKDGGPGAEDHRNDSFRSGRCRPDGGGYLY